MYVIIIRYLHHLDIGNVWQYPAAQCKAWQSIISTSLVISHCQPTAEIKSSSGGQLCRQLSFCANVTLPSYSCSQCALAPCVTIITAKQCKPSSLARSTKGLSHAKLYLSNRPKSMSHITGESYDKLCFFNKKFLKYAIQQVLSPFYSFQSNFLGREKFIASYKSLCRNSGPHKL